jgi:hypothetical protein
VGEPEWLADGLGLPVCERVIEGEGDALPDCVCVFDTDPVVVFVGVGETDPEPLPEEEGVGVWLRVGDLECVWVCDGERVCVRV